MDRKNTAKRVIMKHRTSQNRKRQKKRKRKRKRKRTEVNTMHTIKLSRKSEARATNGRRVEERGNG